MAKRGKIKMEEGLGHFCLDIRKENRLVLAEPVKQQRSVCK